MDFSESKKENDVSVDIKTLLDSVPQVSDDFDVIEKIGEGTFSKVFKARLRGTSHDFALKYIIPTSLPSRIESELRCLLQAGGQSNVMEVSTYVMNRGHFVIVMPYFAHDRFCDFVLSASVEDAGRYMVNLFQALQRIHGLAIIHRDIKPSNFLFNRKLHKYALVDFGLAQRQEDISRALQADAEGRGSKLAAMRAQAKMARKRTLGPSNAENESHRKRLCFKGLSPLSGQQGEAGTRVLQPLSNRMNVTVHPAGSQAIRKPPAPLLKEVLWASGSNNKKLPSLPAPPATAALASCRCYGKGTVCTHCLGRATEVAPRAGTPGFRAPEVLLKYKAQTAAIDVWSSGIVFLSILSGRYPFFKATDDLTALAEISTLLGTERMKQVAEKLGKKLTTTLSKPSLDLKMLCQKLRQSGTKRKTPVVFPDAAYALLSRLLDPDPESRITVTEALRHDFFKTLTTSDR